MGSISYASKEVICKVVYYGPAGSGKTTILRTVQAKVPRSSGEIISISTHDKRTLFFDYFLLHVGRIRGFSVSFQLYTVPGAEYYSAIRKIVLRGADGIIFVADSSSERLGDNLRSLDDLVTNLKLQGRDIEDTPLVFQYNKRDLANALPVWQLEKELNRWGNPSYESVSAKGEGIFPPLKAICKMSLSSLGGAWGQPVAGNRFRVVIVGTESDGARLAVARRLSSYAKISLERAEALLDRTPIVIAKSVDARRAELLKMKFQELGAFVRIEPVGAKADLVSGRVGSQ